jgi:hypothetical protein
MPLAWVMPEGGLFDIGEVSHASRMLWWRNLMVTMLAETRKFKEGESGSFWFCARETDGQVGLRSLLVM